MSLMEQRQETKQVITDLIQNTFFRRYWQMIGTFIGRGRTVSIWVSAAVVLIASVLAGLAISVLLKETFFTRPEIILNDLIWVTYTYFMIPLILSINSRSLEFLRHRLLEFMENEQQIQELKNWMAQWLGNPFLQFLFYFGYSAVLAPLSFYNVYHTTNFSLGTTWIYFINYFHIGAGLYGLILLIAFLLKLRNWRLSLYPDDPASSPILMQLSEELRDYILMFSFGPTLFMLLTGLTGVLGTLAILAILVVSWVPLLTLFILGNHVFSRMITRVKYERLAILQSTIMKLSNVGELDTKKTAQVMSLMDYHDRIKATPNSLINSQSIANLLGSLALPLLALLIDAWPYIQNLFK